MFSSVIAPCISCPCLQLSSSLCDVTSEVYGGLEVAKKNKQTAKTHHHGPLIRCSVKFQKNNQTNKHLVRLFKISCSWEKSRWQEMDSRRWTAAVVGCGLWRRSLVRHWSHYLYYQMYRSHWKSSIKLNVKLWSIWKDWHNKNIITTSPLWCE